MSKPLMPPADCAKQPSLCSCAICMPTVLLCGREHGRAWADAQGGGGELLAVAEASRRGAADWAGCADAVRALAT